MEQKVAEFGTKVPDFWYLTLMNIIVVYQTKNIYIYMYIIMYVYSFHEKVATVIRCMM